MKFSNKDKILYFDNKWKTAPLDFIHVENHHIIKDGLKLIYLSDDACVRLFYYCIFKYIFMNKFYNIYL